MEERKDKNEDNTKLVAYSLLFIIAIFAAIFAIKYFWQPTVKIQSYMYNGFVFKNITGIWYTEVQRAGTNQVYNVPVHFGPRELEDIKVEGKVVSFEGLKSIYIAFDPLGRNLNYVALSAAELSTTLGQVMNITPVAACTVNETETCKSRPIVNCNSAPAILLNESNETKVFVSDNCIVLQGYKKEMVRAADRLILNWLKVMP